MALQLINVGTTSNDGTGDTLRTAGQKMNANASELFALVADTQGALGEKLEADDLANFETTAQLNARDTGNRARANHTGTQAISTVTGLQTALDAKLEAEALTDLTASDAAQDTAIAALILNDEAQDTMITGLANDAMGLSGEIAALATTTTAALAAKLEAPAIADFETTAQLNDRDTANRARANHTGTQPAATVEGLATVATSGAYGDLSGRPTIPYGLTYDQQAEPSSPATGATWRERSAGGLIVGDWEWSGSLWLGRLEYCLLYSNIAANVGTSNVLSNYPRYPVLLVGYSANTNTLTGTHNAANCWRFRHNQVDNAEALSTADQIIGEPLKLVKWLDSPVIVSAPQAADNQLFRTGTPTNLPQYSVSSFYRVIRP